MKRNFKRIVILCTGTLLLACADIAYRTPQPQQFPQAERAYQLGRMHHLAQRLDLARAAYEEALLAVPSHLKARNGLAVLHAEQGDLNAAIAHWETMTASRAGVESAFLFSNLGFAYYLRGEYARAQAALENACLQDPLNHRAWRHLGNVLVKLGDHERARAMHRQAAALQGHDIKADLALVPGTRLALVDNAVRPEDDGNWAQTNVRQTEDGLWVLERIEAKQSRTAVLLEISNGNGVTGMARSLARSIGSGEGRVVRLTNHKGFAVRKTRVEYQGAFKLAAERLAERFGNAQVVEAGRGGPADIRVVLGHDLLKLAAPAVAGAVTPAAGAS